MEGLYVLWKTSIYRVLWLDLKGSFCNSVEVLCQIVGLNICICDTNSRWLLPKSSRPQPIPCRVCLGDRITTAGCILLSWTRRFREVTVLATGCQQCELPATPSEFYSWGMIWVTAIFFKIDLISIASSQQNGFPQSRLPGLTKEALWLMFQPTLSSQFFTPAWWVLSAFSNCSWKENKKENIWLKNQD